MPENALLTRDQMPLLRGVSRSFYLSIRLLPPALQAPIAVAYLLARATDTVADTTAMPAAERLNLLMGLAQAIQSPTGQLQTIAPLVSQFASQQNDAHERALMHALPECLALLQALAPDDQTSVRWVLKHITQGQVRDVQGFGQGPGALRTDAELDEYTWLVAGCVGEFWTELCARHLPDFAAHDRETMRLAGRSFGMGLQRLNILRDAGADLRSGRCYLPLERLSALGLSAQDLMQAALAPSGSVQGDHPVWTRLQPLWDSQLAQTSRQLQQGLIYSQSLRHFRMRVACALPALIGARTVALLRQAGPSSLKQPVKMPRSEMRGLIWRLLWRWASPQALGREFERLSQCENPKP